MATNNVTNNIASPGLATFLAQTSTNLPANGIDLSNAATQVTIGCTPATVPGGDFYSLTILATGTPDPLAVFGDNGGRGHSYFWSASGSTQGTGGAGTEMNFLGVPGSIASPLAAQNNYTPVVMRFGTGNGVDNPWTTAWQTLVDIKVVCVGTQSSSNNSGKLVFATANGAVADPVDRVTIDNAGLLTAAFGISSTTLTLTTTPLAIGSGGTGQTSQSAAFNALSPITSTGDIIIGNGSNSATRLGIGSTNQALVVTSGTLAYKNVPILSTAGGAATYGVATGITTSTTITTSAVTASTACILISIQNITGTLGPAAPIIYLSTITNGSFDINVALLGTVTSLDVSWLVVAGA